MPRALPALGDDFDWLLRDYDGFRLFMLEELAARYPERRRWTPADLEVVLVEALAVDSDRAVVPFGSSTLAAAAQAWAAEALFMPIR